MSVVVFESVRRQLTTCVFIFFERGTRVGGPTLTGFLEDMKVLYGTCVK